MRTNQLQTQLWLPHFREEIFRFFSDPRNLDRLTPPWLHFEILTAENIEMRIGALLDYRLRLRGIPIRWQSEITVWDPPNRFVDRQTKGPYRQWVHEHIFSEHNGGTLVEDSVVYAAPGGKLVQQWLVEPDLTRIFHYRHEVLQSIFNPQRLQPVGTRP